MEKNHIESQPIIVVDAIVCDICLKEIRTNECGRDDIIKLRGTGRFHSPFGHGTKWSLDICESCLITRLGEFIQQEAPEKIKKPVVALPDSGVASSSQDMADRDAALEILREGIHHNDL